MEPSLFPSRDLFPSSDSDDELDGAPLADDADDKFSERTHDFAGTPISVREFMFHPVNANLAWPGAAAFASWLLPRVRSLHGRRILELGSGTGALAIFLRVALGCDVTTCDYADEDIRANIAHNCRANGIEPLPHVPHTWGDKFPVEPPRWDLLLASDILLYVKEYPNLVKTLYYLLRCYEPLSPSPEAAASAQAGTSWEMPEPESCGAGGAAPAIADQSVGAAGVAPESSSSTRAAAPDTHAREVAAIGGHSATGKGRQAGAHSNEGQVQCHWPRPSLLMSWRRRIPKSDELLFFDGCRNSGMVVDDLGSRVYNIYLVQDGKAGVE